MASQHDVDFRNGANAIMGAIREVEELISGGPEQTTEEFFAKQDAAIKALLDTVGPLPARVAGAMACLAEVMVKERQNGGFFELDTYHPEASMTPSEVMASRAVFTAEVAAL